MNDVNFVHDVDVQWSSSTRAACTSAMIAP